MVGAGPVQEPYRHSEHAAERRDILANDDDRRILLEGMIYGLVERGCGRLDA